MSKNSLHITNGSSLTNRLQELSIEGDFLTWHEMLCEGPTQLEIDSSTFFETRKEFLSNFYDVEVDESAFHSELDKLNNTEAYSKIILWFEYDLFCHINLMAVISLIKQKKIELPLYLVYSGRIKGSKDLKALNELNDEQLLSHYSNKVLLSDNDIDLAKTIWEIYCGKDHNLLKPYIVTTSSFEYLNSCLKAHLKRFPDSRTGLCRLEFHILNIIKDETIKSRHHLLGYILNYQGYYGYGDLQISRMIDKLSIFFTETKNKLELNRKGYEALIGTHNFAIELNNNLVFGGANRLHFQFNVEENKLIKTHVNAN